jgi:hypothetical protein
MADPDGLAHRLIQRAHLRDGLPEIAVGTTFLLVGALNYAQAVVPRQSVAFKAVVAFGILVPLLAMALPWALKRARARYFIERSGYVKPKPIGRKPMAIGLGIALAVSASIGIFASVHGGFPPDAWVLAGTGLLGGVLAGVCGQTPRFYVGGALMAVAGIAVALAGLALLLGFAVISGLAGLLSLVSGVVGFLRFRRQSSEAGE